VSIDSESQRPTARAIVLKTIVTHTVTYFVMGALALVVFDYSRLYAETSYRLLMRQTTDPLVMAGPLFQPLRGLIFGVVFVVLRRSLFEQANGWFRIWLMLVFVGILGTFGPAPASVEGMIYTTIPVGLQLVGSPEVLVQALLLAVIVSYWVRHPRTRWLTWVMGTAFVLALLLPVLGLLAGQHG
jgi:hypothetical protein